MTSREEARKYTDPLFSFNFTESLTASLKGERFRLISYLLRQNASCKRLVGHILPTDFHQLSRRIPTLYTNRLELEYHWAAAVLTHYGTQVRHFLVQRNCFLRSLLRADFTTAKDAISSIVNNCGMSLWSIGANFLLAELYEGLDANRKLLSSFLTDTTPGWVQLIATFASERVEGTICPDEYIARCGEFTNGAADDTQYLLRVRQYLKYKFLQHLFRGAEHLPFLLNFEESQSLIDRFLAFTFVSKQIANSAKPPASQQLLIDLQGMQYSFDDDSLNLSAAMAGLEYEPDRDHIISCMAALGAYSRGDYQLSLKLAESAIEHFPDYLEFYEIICKSTLRLGVPLNNVFAPASLGFQLLRVMYSVIGRDHVHRDSLASMRKLAFQLSDFTLGQQLHALYEQETRDALPASANFYAATQAAIPTPRLSLAMSNRSNCIRFLDILGACYPNNETLGVFGRILHMDSEGAAYSVKTIPEGRQLKYVAIGFERSREFDKALAIYEQIARNTNTQIIRKAESIVDQCRCLVALKRVDEGVRLLVTHAAQHAFLVSAATMRALLERYGQSEGSLPNIEWAVLWGIATQEGAIKSPTETLNGIVDDFLTSRALTRPMELKPIAASFNPAPLTYFLRYMCTTGILDSSPWFDSVNDLEEERVAVCEWLKELDSGNAATYSREIADIKRTAAMRQLSQQSGQSKIFVDTKRIASGLSTSFKDRIARCLAFAHLANDLLRQGLEVRAYSISTLRKLDRKIDVRLIDNGQYQFKSLFMDIRHEFLSSNEFGLDAILSQRIRHGVLSGELRPIFETRRLITQKDASGEYLDNFYWLERLHSTEGSEQETIATAFANLSQRIDSMVGEVRNSWIQIRTAQNEKGYFDFDFTDEDISSMNWDLSASDSATNFVDRIFDRLWERTEENLSRLRNAITSDLDTELGILMDVCVAEVESVVGSSRASELRDVVTNTKTYLHYALNRIAEWFRIDHPEIIGEFHLATLIDAVLETVNRYLGPNRIALTSDIDRESAVGGQYFRGLWDLFFILFDNMVRHAGLNEVQASLRCEFKNDTLEVSVSNQIADGVDIPLLQEVASKMSGRLERFADLQILRSEGGSGLYKLHKILSSDLNCKDYSARFRATRESGFEAIISAEVLP
jgi:hypothetical protein